MDQRLRHLAEQLDAGLIARREFLRKSAVITGGTAAGLSVLGKMAHAQSGTKMRVWLFKSFVTASNDILAKQVEAWGTERKVQVDMDWATFGDREQKFVAAIEAGQPPGHRRDELPRAHPVQVRPPRRLEARQGHRGRARRPPALCRARDEHRRAVLRRRRG